MKVRPTGKTPAIPQLSRHLNAAFQFCQNCELADDAIVAQTTDYFLTLWYSIRH
jgi:hypothetical protein